NCVICNSAFRGLLQRLCSEAACAQRQGVSSEVEA
ncbi:hypothetical protein A2U01_0102586, partial [Trifolium medium]|nr:hypothetical protein [Trifolium medium]